MVSPYASPSNLPAGYAEQSRVPEIIVGAIVPSVIGTAFVLIRSVGKIRGHLWGWDDTLLILAWICIVLTSCFTCVLTRYGAGRHTITINIEVYIINLKYAFATRLLYRLALSLTKWSICASYLRFFPDKRSRQYTFAMAAAILLYTIPLWIYSVFQCRPVSRAWSTDSKSSCDSSKPGTIVTAACNVLLDLIMIIFTISRLLPLKMPARRKVPLLIVTNLGFLVIVASIVRTVHFCRVVNKPDFSYRQAAVSTWSSVESNTGLVCASAPYLNLLWRQLRGKDSTSRYTEKSMSLPPRPRTKPDIYVHEEDAGSDTLVLVDQNKSPGQGFHAV